MPPPRSGLGTERLAVGRVGSSSKPAPYGRHSHSLSFRRTKMPKASKETASETVEVEGYEGHFEHFDGGYSVGFETYTADADLAPLFKGLPGDRCQCPHWGYVKKGKLAFTYADGHTETYEEGDAYYAPPGHTPQLFAGSEVVEFHPTEELAKTMEVVEKNMEAMSQ
jgi:hypothetical protein